MTQEGGFPINWYETDNYAVYDNTASYGVSKVWKIFLILSFNGKPTGIIIFLFVLSSNVCKNVSKMPNVLLFPFT